MQEHWAPVRVLHTSKDETGQGGARKVQAMKKILLTTAFAAAVALAACGPKAEEASTPATEQSATAMTPMEAVVDPAAKTLDFATKVAKADATEIAVSKAAAAKSTNAEVKKYANMLVTDHTATTKALKAWAAKTTVALPADAELVDQGKVDDIANADAKDQKAFNDKYLDSAIDAHEDAINAFNDYATNGAEPDLKAFAVATLPKLQAHLEAAKALRDKLNAG
jgi:putative membrane protein